VTVTLTVLLTGCSIGSSSDTELRPGRFDRIIPAPMEVTHGAGTFTLSGDTTITVEPGAEESADAVALLREIVETGTGFTLPVVDASAGAAGDSDVGNRIVFTPSAGGARPAEASDGHAGAGAPMVASNDATGMDGDQVAPFVVPPVVADEGYSLEVVPQQVTVSAAGPEGFVWAVQTLRQILPEQIESTGHIGGTWQIPVGTVTDLPRYEWRGFLVDVARHFQPVEKLEAFIDLASAYKFNRFHLHLTDDQGWRIEIPGHPELTEVGASAEIGGSGGGGYYTTDQFRRIVRYAQSRGVTVVPEIEMPSHSLAAITAIPSLRCPSADGDADEPDYDPESSPAHRNLCPTDEATFTFLDTVIGEVAAMTLGPYLHVGGDEAFGMLVPDYFAFVDRATSLVHRHGKSPVGWAEIAVGQSEPTALLQSWTDPHPSMNEPWAAAPGVIASPAALTYINATYDEGAKRERIGWVGVDPLSTEKAYDWDPETHFTAVPDVTVVGLEACLWGDHISDRSKMDELVLPRLPGYGELGWSPRSTHSWADYRVRLATHAPRWDAWGLRYYRDPTVPWADTLTADDR
jgi:hexosaminidase